MSIYCVNDIDKTLSDNKTNAARYGWKVEVFTDGFLKEKRNPLAEPSLIPAIDIDKIVMMMKLAYRFDCEKTCGEYCYHPHPLLQIGKYKFCKLCTVIWEKLVKEYYK